MSNLLTLVLGGLGVLGLLSFIAVRIMIRLRRVVPTNEVHIVQSSKKTTSFGKDTTNGNTLQNQNKAQVVKEQERITKEKEMAVLLVQHTKTAELNRAVAEIAAEQNKNTSIINAQAANQSAILKADADKETSIKIAEGKFEAQSREAKAIELLGKAKAEAEKALQLAPVQAQITLAKEIGENGPYQQYLTNLRQIEANQAIGVEQAKALSNADIKIISNTETPTSGLDNVMDLFSSKGGTQIGAALQGLANTEQGKNLLDAVGLGKKEKAETPQ